MPWPLSGHARRGTTIGALEPSGSLRRRVGATPRCFQLLEDVDHILDEQPHARDAAHARWSVTSKASSVTPIATTGPACGGTCEALQPGRSLHRATADVGVAMVLEDRRVERLV